MGRICLLIPYYGRWPDYFPLFLKGCEKNEVLDVLFFTDLPRPANAPKNVIFVNLSLEELKEIVRKKLGLNPAITTPYKLCDFRPAFGVLFSEFIKDYTYWGWGDIDIIYGDINAFLPKGIGSSELDIVSFRKPWVSGGFVLLKNDERICNLFKENEDYKKVFQDGVHYSYGECGKLWDEFRKGGEILKRNLPVSNFTQIVKSRLDLTCFFEDVLKESIGVNETLEYDNGKISSGNREYMLYHFISERRRGLFRIPLWRNIPDSFSIDRYGPFLKSGHPLRRQLTKMFASGAWLMNRVLSKIKRMVR